MSFAFAVKPSTQTSESALLETPSLSFCPCEDSQAWMSVLGDKGKRVGRERVEARVPRTQTHAGLASEAGSLEAATGNGVSRGREKEQSLQERGRSVRFLSCLARLSPPPGPRPGLDIWAEFGWKNTAASRRERHQAPGQQPRSWLSHPQRGFNSPPRSRAEMPSAVFADQKLLFFYSVRRET